MQAEVAAIGDEAEALDYAWGCFRAACGHVIGLACQRLAAVHTAAVMASSVAVLLGCGFMHAAGAPDGYVWMNLLSLVFGLATFRLLPRRRLQREPALRAKLCFAMGALLLGASLRMDPNGASAWMQLGPVRLNLLWLLLPALVIASDIDVWPGAPRGAQRWAVGGLLMALLAVALLADAALALVLAGILGLRAWRRGSRLCAALGLLSLAALAVALRAGPGWPEAGTAPFVDRVVQQGFEQHPAIGLGLGLALLAPLWPALRCHAAREHGLLWALLLALSLVGWLPSALVGFGGSFICGHLLSLALLPGDSPWPASGGRWPQRRRRPPALPPGARSGRA